ncbi:hypothetical protein ETB97_005425 [Aspergillus alliaceus]|uniref:7-dehydrocholesterol reductase n=1 Tax=Petromyces alliaceus TaxID=209559 RepID=A0A8H5ZZ57_PETAA|nr:hypothetical protein ETB97_005425 [Aspergillus burnettii]
MQNNASSAYDLQHRMRSVASSTCFLVLMLSATPLTSIWWTAITDYNGSLQLSFTHFVADPKESLSWYSLSSHSTGVTFAKWIFFEAVLYALLPGRICAGQPTPSGHTLPYTMNGLSFFTSSFVTFLAAVALRQVELSFIARNWKEIILALNVFAWLLTGAAFLKGRIAPSYRFDTRSNGSYIYDIWRGIELHPRFGTAWDLKIFHNARWTMTTLAMMQEHHHL